jgi:fructose-1,6-bisphosphatase/inositol monophosphatase family enzyme
VRPVDGALIERVGALLREVAAEVILPRHRRLRDGEVSEKTSGELVTVVDLESERRLAQALPAWLPGSRVIGEEGAAAAPALLQTLDDGDVWLVDPLDGTANFIAGSADFAVMLALLRQGEPVGAWMLHPLSGELFVAEQGGGAFANGERVRVTASSATPAAGLRGIVKTRFLPPELRERIAANERRVADVLPGTGCAGGDYPAIVRGVPQFCLYWRTLPWDHAPGTLWLREAGGHAARLDGRPYRPSDDQRGLLIARDDTTWLTARAALFD